MEILGPLYAKSKRFGIEEGEAVRVIDDLEDSLVNDAFGTANNLTM